MSPLIGVIARSRRRRGNLLKDCFASLAMTLLFLIRTMALDVVNAIWAMFDFAVE